MNGTQADEARTLPADRAGLEKPPPRRAT